MPSDELGATSGSEKSDFQPTNAMYAKSDGVIVMKSSGASIRHRLREFIQTNKNLH